MNDFREMVDSGLGESVLTSKVHLLLADGILQICPHSVALCLVSLVLDLEEILCCLSCLAVQDNVILGQRLLTNTLQFVLEYLAGILVVESEHASDVAHPCGSEREEEVFGGALFDPDLVAGETEAAALGLIEDRRHGPLLLGIVHDGDFLSDGAAGGDLEFQLRLNLLRDRVDLEFVEADVGAIERLEDIEAWVGGWLGRFDGHLEKVDCGVQSLGRVTLLADTTCLNSR